MIFTLNAHGRRPFRDKQIELAQHVRRPGGDRDRECAAVRGGAGAHARSSSRWSCRPRSASPAGINMPAIAVLSCSERSGVAKPAWKTAMLQRKVARGPSPTLQHSRGAADTLNSRAVTAAISADTRHSTFRPSYEADGHESAAVSRPTRGTSHYLGVPLSATDLHSARQVRRKPVRPFDDRHISLLKLSRIRPSSQSRTCGFNEVHARTRELSRTLDELPPRRIA